MKTRPHIFITGAQLDMLLSGKSLEMVIEAQCREPVLAWLTTKTPNDHILYLCDKEQCEDCFELCNHTTDIRHAKNFQCVRGDWYQENGGDCDG